jgi:glycosyltransferase involved in cell wall biosynthesis/SAM-dependent methyltransferase
MDRLLRGLADRGHEVALVCGGPVAAHDYEIVDSGGTYGQYVAAPFICMTRFGRADVMIDVENGLPFFSPLWRRRPSVCLVHHIHSDQWHGRFPAPLAVVLKNIERHVMPVVYRNRTFVCISDSTADNLHALGVPRERIRIIEPGMDDPPFPPAARSEAPLFLSLNRFVPHKRLELLLSAWEIAAREIPDGRLVLAGDGPKFEEIAHLAWSIPRVDVVGHVTEETKYRLLGEAWAVVTAAHHEGWGFSMIEAAAVGTPALAIDVPGIRDAVIDGVTGVLVRAEEDELASAMARAWVDLTLDHERREALGKAAHQRATQMGWDQTVDRWLAVLEEEAARPSPRKPSQSSRKQIGTMSRVASWALTIGSAALASPTKVSTRARSVPKKPFIGELRRSIGLLKGFRTQYDDPDGFYALLADDTVDLVKDYQPVEGQRVIDVGGGPGYFAQAFRRAGAASVFVEPFWDAMTAPGRSLGYGVIGDGMNLPFPDGAFDVSHSSNVIEHVTDPQLFFDEMLRVVRPGGLVFMAFTNWFSPFGGHETSPWHYLGGERAVARYEKKAGHPPKNRFGSSLFRLDIAEVLAWARRRQDADLIDTFPRYYPSWTKPLVAIPGVREVVTWNLVIVMRRR